MLIKVQTFTAARAVAAALHAVMEKQSYGLDVLENKSKQVQRCSDWTDKRLLVDAVLEQ